MPPAVPLIDRFWTKVVKHPDGCWEWRGAVLPNGYGVTKHTGERRNTYVHRFSYELAFGPIPEGMEIDHLCHDPALCQRAWACPHRRCVNPSHLRATTHRENTLRGGSLPAIESRQTHCQRGHPLSGANLSSGQDGHRRCRTCDAAKSRAWCATHRDIMVNGKRVRPLG